jgi:serine/threonine-protein kinase
MGDNDAEIRQRAEARLGRVLREKWRLDRLIGLGGMAAVYAATHRNGKRAAIKILHPEAAAIADIRARFLREGYLANRVHHPGALSILDDDVDEEGTVFLVMELLQGETLEARWHRMKHLPWLEVCVVVDKVLDILVAAHAKAIVHRDLKPGNVFIEDTGGIKVLDFGIARLNSMAPQPGDTARDGALGTPGFMPPEQARGRWADVDAQSDVWAVGATAFAVLTDRYVHEAPTLNEQLLAAMTEPAPPVRSLVPDVPDAFAAVIDRALAFDKKLRWSEARAMQKALREAYEAVTGEPFQTAPPLSTRTGTGLQSILRDAPTMSPADLDAQRQSTARPVSARPLIVDAPRTSRARAYLLGAGALAILAAGYALLGRGERATPTTPPAAAREPHEHAIQAAAPASAPALPLPLPSAASSGTSPADAGGGMSDAAPHHVQTASPKAQRAPKPRTPRVTKPKPAPAPSESGSNVDIFTRRK